MRLHNYLTDYIVIQQVSLNTFVFTRGHSVSNVIDSTHFNTLRGDFSSAEVTSLAAVRKPHCSRTGLQFSSVHMLRTGLKPAAVRRGPFPPVVSMRQSSGD